MRSCAVLARAIGRDVRHRARPIQRDQRDDVLEAVRAHVDQRAAHALAFHLEHADRLAAGQHLVGFGVVERQVGQIDVDAAPRAAASRRRSSTVSVFRPRKSNFTRPAGSTHFMLNWVTGISDFGIAIERHQFGQRPVADDDAGGVGRGVAVQAFELLRDVEGAPRHRDRASRSACSRGSSSIARLSVTGLAGFCGTSLHSLSTWP